MLAPRLFRQFASDFNDFANGLANRFSRAERIRRWSYDFDPSGLELLRRAVEPIAAARRMEAVPAGA